MRVIGATFSDRGAAERALADLRKTFDVGPNDASLAQLGSSSDRADLTLLAGHFADERVQEVRQSIVSFGGKIVTDGLLGDRARCRDRAVGALIVGLAVAVDEAATRSRTTPPPTSAERPLGGQEASAVGGGVSRRRQQYFAR